MQTYQLDDVKFLKSENWPNWPICPVKRYNDGKLECGCVFSGHVTVYIVSIFDLPRDLSNVKKFDYASFEDMVADGWQVD